MGALLFDDSDAKKFAGTKLTGEVMSDDDLSILWLVGHARAFGRTLLGRNRLGLNNDCWLFVDGYRWSPKYPVPSPKLNISNFALIFDASG